MRNILEYPMTYEEAEKILLNFKESCDKKLVGDIRPYAIDWVLEKLSQLNDIENSEQLRA